MFDFILFIAMAAIITGAACMMVGGLIRDRKETKGSWVPVIAASVVILTGAAFYVVVMAAVFSIENYFNI